MRTESGDVASQSGGKLNVLKGTTNTDTTEDYDLDQGGGGGGGSLLWGVVQAEGKESQKNEGSIVRYQTEDQNVSNMDISREKRESHAYSTNLNQLYTLLQGYHLGTNRAMFFMQPRPHMQDAKFTFIRGLRRLEGIQEFFLIINRPATVPGICVEAALETAHIKLERAYSPRLIPASALYTDGNLNRTAAALGFSEYDFFYQLYGLGEQGLAGVRDLWNVTGIDIRHFANDPEKEWSPNLSVGIQQFYICKDVAAQVPGIGTEDVALIFEEYESNAGDFFVTGRLLCACVTPTAPDPVQGTNVDCEKSEKSHISTCDKTPGGSILFTDKYLGVATRDAKWSEKSMKAGNLNAMVEDLNKGLWSSLGSTERFAYGEVSFLETDFMLDEIAQFLRLLKKGGDIEDRPLANVDSMRSFIDRGLGRGGARTVVDLGMLSTNQVAHDFEVSIKEAGKIRRDLLFAALNALDEKTIKPNVPRVNPISERFANKFPPAEAG